MLNFTSLKPCSLIMLHVKFENLGRSGFRERVISMDLKARVKVNLAMVDVSFQTVTLT